jgi:hypothetical protein
VESAVPGARGSVLETMSRLSAFAKRLSLLGAALRYAPPWQ